MRHFLAALGLLSLLAACATEPTDPIESTDTSTPVVAGEGGASEPANVGFTAVWDGQVAEAAEWTGYVHDALVAHGAALLDPGPGDMAAFCPAYGGLGPHDREQVWITLISAMAKRESSFNPATRFDEPGLDEDSLGLMQLSLADARIYGCNFATEADIMDPERNLDCAVRIMARLVGRDGVLGGGDAGNVGAARYWSVLRSQNANARRFIVEQTTALPVCPA